LGLGLAGACLSVAGVALMPVALHLFPSWSLGAAIGLGYVFVGLSAVLTPVVMPWLSSRLGWRRVVLSLSLLCLLPAALIALAKEEVPGPVPITETALYDVRFWLIVVVAFLYPPLEQSLAIWPRPYLAEIGYPARTIIRLVIGFWSAFFLMRFGLGWMVRTGNEAWLVLTLLVLSSMVLGNLAGAYGPAGGFLGFWLLGACYGPLLPVLLATLESGDTHRLPGWALGAVFAILALSSLIAQPLLAAFAKKHTSRGCMRIPMILGLVMAAPMLVAAVIRFGK
jgi:MFS family permease